MTQPTSQHHTAQSKESALRGFMEYLNRRKRSGRNFYSKLCLFCQWKCGWGDVPQHQSRKYHPQSRRIFSIKPEHIWKFLTNMLYFGNLENISLIFPNLEIQFLKQVAKYYAGRGIVLNQKSSEFRISSRKFNFECMN